MYQIRTFYLIVILFLISAPLWSQKKGWVARINDTQISPEEFNIRFQYYLKGKYVYRPDLMVQAETNIEEKESCLDDLINETIIFQEAKKSKIDQQEDVQQMINLYTKQIIINTFLEKTLGNKIKISEKEIDAFYNENKEEYGQIDPDIAAKKIEQLLMMKKYEKEVSKIILRLKENYKIERNKKAIQKIKLKNELNITN